MIPPASPPLAQQPVLLYTDDAPCMAWVVQALTLLAQQTNRQFVRVTEPAALETRLVSGRPWRIFALLQHTGDEPPCADIIRNHLRQQPNSMATLWVWHLNNTEPPAGTEVFPTMSLFTWDHGYTTGSYNHADPEEAGAARLKTWTVPHYNWPDFRGIVLRDPAIFAGRAPVRTTASTGSAEDPMNCYLECLTQLSRDLAHCDVMYDFRRDRCYKTYGWAQTQPPSDPGDLSALQTCLDQARESLKGCTDTAFNDYRHCRNACDAGIPVTPPPAVPSNP